MAMLKKRVYLLIAFIFLIAPSREVRAELKGNAELLKMASDSYRANLDQLRTWKGKAEIKMQSEDRDQEKHDKIVVECAVEFAYDSSSGDYRYDIDIHKDVSIVDGKEQPRLRTKRRARIFTDDVYLELVFMTDNPSANRTAYIRAEKSMQAGIGYLTFEPLFFFTDQGTPIDEFLQVLYDNFNHEAVHGEVLREGDIIKVIQAPPDSGITIELWIDLSQGGNPTKLETIETMGGDTMRTVVSWDWKQVKEVWVPDRVVEDHSSKMGHQTRKQLTTVKWKKHRLNLPLSQNEFGWKNLGLRRGDRIRDTRTQTDHIFE